MKNVKELDLVKFIQDVYAMSAPRGLGFLHFQPGDLSVRTAEEFVELRADDERIVLSLDYIQGRACKMTVWRGAGGTYDLPDSWYDHTDAQYTELLRQHNITQ